MTGPAITAIATTVENALPAVRAGAEATGISAIVWARIMTLEQTNPVEFKLLFGLEPIHFDQIKAPIEALATDLFGPNPHAASGPTTEAVNAAVAKLPAA